MPSGRLGLNSMVVTSWFEEEACVEGVFEPFFSNDGFFTISSLKELFMIFFVRFVIIS